MINYDLVIIGGGSAGIAAAVSAYDNGIKSIIVLEKEKALGGILLQCIHNGFGLQTYKEELTGPEYAYREERELIKRNIDFKLETMVTEITKELLVTYINPKEGVKTIQAKAIISATGCLERNRGAIQIPGDRPSGVLTAGAAQKYLNIEGYLVGKKVFILGSGDIGLIMARRMTLEGAKVLGVAELMPYSNGLNRNIVQCLNDFDIPLYLSHTVKRIIGKDRLERIILAQVDDKFNFIDGTEKEFEVDTLLLSVGLIPSNKLLQNIGVEMHPVTKGPIVDDNYQTSVKGIFSCGNSLHVHDLVDFVSEESKKVGFFAAKYIKGELFNSKKINVSNGIGVNYVLPTQVNPDGDNDPQVFFRVKNPHQTCYLYIYADSVLVKKIKKTYLIPSEMERVKLSKEYLINCKNLTLEVHNE